MLSYGIFLHNFEDLTNVLDMPAIIFSHNSTTASILAILATPNQFLPMLTRGARTQVLQWIDIQELEWMQAVDVDAGCQNQFGPLVWFQTSFSRGVVQPIDWH